MIFLIVCIIGLVILILVCLNYVKPKSERERAIEQIYEEAKRRAEEEKLKEAEKKTPYRASC